VRKLIVVEYVSLDGVIQGPGHGGEDREGGFEQGGWTGPFMADHRRYNSEFFQTAGGFLLGRKTYEIWAPYWPTVTDESDEIARALNTLPKYVASSSLHEAEWEGTSLLGGHVASEVARLKGEPGKPILCIGSSELAQTLMRHELVDEFQLWVHPVVLGSGKRLFREGGPTIALRLVDSRTTAGGLLILTYAVATDDHCGHARAADATARSNVCRLGLGAPTPPPRPLRGPVRPPLAPPRQG
jgi:dihydrofolate reductase